MSDRKTITIDADLHERLADAKPAGQSWTEFLDNLADGGVNTANTVVVGNIDELARATADEVENRMTRR